MEFLELIKKCRTVRRFKQTPIKNEVFEKLIDCARFSPSSGNIQHLKFFISNTKEMNQEIYPTIQWAGALKDWNGPEPKERPVSYIIILLDKNISLKPSIDPGIVAQSIMLGARSLGIGCCMIGSYNKSKVSNILNLPETISTELILALGEPAEEVVLEDYTDSLAYYRDDEKRHHVPKRSREDLTWKN